MPRYAASRLVRCRACGMVFASDIPSHAELVEHYARYPAAGPLHELTVRRYRELLGRFECFRRTGRLLDVGCGDGHFLAVARDRGWTVYGSEYGEGPRHRALERGLDVREAPFPAGTDETGSFDVVTAMEVLEHVVSPLDEVRRVGVLLRPGGCFYLTTPNYASLSRHIAGPGWRAIEYPEHLNLFTPRTMHRLLTNTGLRRVTIATTGVSPSDIWGAIHPPHGDGSAGEHGPGVDQTLRARAQSSRIVDLGVHGVNLALSRMRAGDTIKALYVRG